MLHKCGGKRKEEREGEQGEKNEEKRDHWPGGELSPNYAERLSLQRTEEILQEGTGSVSNGCASSHFSREACLGILSRLQGVLRHW